MCEAWLRRWGVYVDQRKWREVFEYRQTSRQVSRGALPDAETYDRMVLVKSCSVLRATYQIRLLTYMAQRDSKQLVIHMRKGSKLHASLLELRRTTGNTIQVKRDIR